MLFKFGNLFIDCSSALLSFGITCKEVATRYNWIGISAALLTDLNVVRLISIYTHFVHDFLELIEIATVHWSSGGLKVLFEGQPLLCFSLLVQCQIVRVVSDGSS